MSSPPLEGAYLFRQGSVSINELHVLHPSPERLWQHWQVYVEYIDPVMKIIHVPTMQQQVQAVMQNPGKSSKPMEAFLFAMYYSSVTALTQDECQEKFGESRDVLVKRYKHAVEQALARANFLISEEMLVLQSFITFLVCLRSHEDGRVLWSLCGVVMRIAVSFGLHRDGSYFNLKPFEIEMRRRIWCKWNSASVYASVLTPTQGKSWRLSSEHRTTRASILWSCNTLTIASYP